MDKLKQAINNYEIFLKSNGSVPMVILMIWRLFEDLKSAWNWWEITKRQARIIRDVKTTWSMSEREKIRAIGAYHYS
jgi:hypothetical protein